MTDVLLLAHFDVFHYDSSVLGFTFVFIWYRSSCKFSLSVIRETEIQAFDVIAS